MELTVQNVYGLLIRSKLLELDECRRMFAEWNAEAKDAAGNVAQFAKWTVAKGFLTEYQANLLARGHGDGFILNRYKILDRLGKGRMAGVYKARHDTGSIVAIKVLPPSKARDPSLFARFQREARVALKLRHPNIVRTFDVGEAVQHGSSEKLHYLVMEYIDGEPLDDVLQRRRQFPPAEAVRLIYQALQGLQHLHEQGLVHRDIKPANLMLTYGSGPSTLENTLQATVKILDMGLTRVLSDDVEDRPDTPQLTSEGVVLGTPDYMAPEQARDARTADIRADIYSLGCVLFHLLDGKPPFPDTSFISQMIRHATEQPRPLKDANPAVSDGLQQIINYMMAKDPGQRYPTPERAAQALKVFLAAGGEASLSPEGDPKMKKYLTWLEVEGKEKKTAPTPAAPAPTAAPTATPEAAATRKPIPIAQPAQNPSATPGAVPVARALSPGKHKTKTAAKRRGKKGKKSRSALQLPVAHTAAPIAAPAAPPVFDVELVPVPPMLPPASGLTRRELLMFGVGVGTVVVASGLGLLGAWLFGAFDKKDATSDE